ncbi:hypothetical protein EJ110_NYTH40229 [Nymphaea thermarum]|nr:hypothetical protein EJ110_NYTH40229 [Nymphaea thermarum]
MASRISFFRPLPSVIAPATRRPPSRAASPSSLHPKPPQLVVGSQRSNLVVNHPQFFVDGLRRRRLNILPSRAAETENSGPELSSPLETVLTFYDAINVKDYHKLEQLVSDDCYFQDMSFAKPFEGKKKVVSFLKELGSSMGSNVKLVVEDEYGSSGQSMVILAWHMEWRGKYIPFTKAHSFFECEADGKGQRIKKVRVLMEWPLKVGDLALRLMEAVTSLFERFPVAAEKTSPGTV